MIFLKNIKKFLGEYAMLSHDLRKAGASFLKRRKMLHFAKKSILSVIALSDEKREKIITVSVYSTHSMLCEKIMSGVLANNNLHICNLFILYYMVNKPKSLYNVRFIMNMEQENKCIDFEILSELLDKMDKDWEDVLSTLCGKSGESELYSKSGSKCTYCGYEGDCTMKKLRMLENSIHELEEKLSYNVIIVKDISSILDRIKNYISKAIEQKSIEGCNKFKPIGVV